MVSKDFIEATGLSPTQLDYNTMISDMGQIVNPTTTTPTPTPKPKHGKGGR